MYTQYSTYPTYNCLVSFKKRRIVVAWRGFRFCAGREVGVPAVRAWSTFRSGYCADTSDGVQPETVAGISGGRAMDLLPDSCLQLRVCVGRPLATTLYSDGKDTSH